jgi:hypothetical protein
MRNYNYLGLLIVTSIYSLFEGVMILYTKNNWGYFHVLAFVFQFVGFLTAMEKMFGRDNENNNC